MLALLVKLSIALLLDRLLGEPKRGHPLVAFGRWAKLIETHTRRYSDSRSAGMLAWSLAVLPWVALAFMLKFAHPVSGWLVDIALLYFALGARSLTEHALAVASPLTQGNLDQARFAVSRLVSRDTSGLDEAGIARACTESVLENGHDGVFGALFWFCLLGGPGALFFRLANTLDAMWGYRNPRYLKFGWAAARIDDLMGWIPARCTALTYALLGSTKNALICWKRQAPLWSSPNAGPVMASGAGSLAVALGGPAVYQGKNEFRPVLGLGVPPNAATVLRALRLVRTGILLWLAVLIFLAAVITVFQ